MRITTDSNEILMAALAIAGGEGWHAAIVDEAVAQTGKDPMMGRALFPNGAEDLARYFSFWADQEMLAVLATDDCVQMRMRDKIRHAVWVRLQIIAPYKGAVKAVSHFWLRPDRTVQAGQGVWHSADAIWQWAGDTATDYNRYTKRGLLSGVISATMLYWLKDESEDSHKTAAFLEQKIDAVVSVGQKAGKAISLAQALFAQRPFCKRAS